MHFRDAVFRLSKADFFHDTNNLLKQTCLDQSGHFFDKICFSDARQEQSFRRAPENGIF
jgi:hypothetical protein